MNSTAKEQIDLSTQSFKTWVHGLNPEVRDQIRVLHRVDEKWNWVALLFVVIWAGAAIMIEYSPFIALDILGYMIIGISIHGMANMMHEGVHNNLFKKKQTNRFFGVLVGIPSLFSLTAYKVNHLIHHKHTGTETDPDEFRNITRHKFLLYLFFYLWLFVGIFMYLFHVPISALQFGSKRERIRIVLEYLVIGSVIGGVILLALQFDRLDLVFHCWFIPMIFGNLLGNVRGWAEHMMTDKSHFMLNTRTVTSNKVFSFLFLNLNYHLEHHLFPKIPWYNLPKLHQLLQPEYQRVNTTIYFSYVKFLIAALRTGPNGRV